FPWLCRQLGVDDYCYELPPSELRDERTWNEIQLGRIEMAERLRGLGYEVEITVNEKGEVEYRIVGRAEQKPEQQAPQIPPVLPARSSRTRRRRKTTIEGLSGAPEAGEERPRTEAGQQRLEGEPALPRPEDILG
ncbi:MAG: hypothetical protein QXY39_01815, partial [Thermofilaceae archaeon]